MPHDREPLLLDTTDRLVLAELLALFREATGAELCGEDVLRWGLKFAARNLPTEPAKLRTLLSGD